ILIDGPFPADTFFAHHLDKYDLVISPFHDQGLIPFKMLSKSEGVNVTLGLPYYRTSVDHGTAFDIAGQDVADSRSMQSAIKWLEARLSSYQEDSRAYRVFAEYYDDYMAHVNYNLWTELVLREFKNLSGNNPTNILEIACGTATIGCNLVKKGFKVSASDNSAEMLQIGSQKKNCPQLYLADMLDPIETKHDLILCLFDSINYLTSIENVNTMLKNVRKALTANGIFVFDISTYTNSKDNFTDFINLEKSDEFVIVHEADFDSRNMLQRSNLTLMKKDMFGYKLYEENHLQKIYSLEEIQNALTSSGLKVTGLFSPHSEDNLKDLDIEVMEANFERVFYFVTKK
ncbi:MAG: 4-hydroxythreonine-4-phosphate dehydrogenase PdxA, partial [Candidatus Zophobacter franzmannii]|nr:4-hydroxythreonine-4-phosphate dehydrogenase PdxA [Candidatus Zophobacter franzmannii]